MQHNFLCNRLKSLLNLILIGVVVFGLSGCVEIYIEADKDSVYPYEEVTLTAVCTPADSGSYSYLWSVLDAPSNSQYNAIAWKMLDSETAVQTFAPDVPGTYKIDSKVITGGLEGFNIATIVIECVGTACDYTIDPTSLEFGYIQTDKTITVSNNADYPLNLVFDTSSTEEWLTQISGDTTVAAGETGDITVKISRDDLDPGDYETTFAVNASSETADGTVPCECKTITVTMSVGPARILFCVDTSQSMKDTDSEDKRVAAVKEAIDMFYDNERVSYGMIDFDTEAQLLLSGEYIRNQTTLYTAAETLGNDDGWTNYLGDATYYPGALDLVDDMISDMSYYYVVIFLSDGKPTKGNTTSDDIVAKVSDIASPDNVKLYTIYLNGEPETVAETLLNSMAVAGKTTEVHVVTPDDLSFITLDF